MRMSFLTGTMIFLAAISFIACRQKSPPTPATPVQAETILRSHFIGIDRLLAQPDAGELKKIGALPQAAEFRKSLVARIAAVAAESLGGPQLVTNEAVGRTLQLFVGDLLRFESATEVRGGRSRPIEAGLAIQSNPALVARWETNFLKLATALEWGNPRQIVGEKGWLIDQKPRTGRETQTIRFLKAEDGVAIDLAHGGSFLGEALLHQLKKYGSAAPSGGSKWVDGQVNLNHLPRWFRMSGTNWPTADIKIYGKSDNVRTEVKLHYPAAHSWSLEAWNIPTNTVRDPLISFTAVQGLRAWLSKQPLAQKVLGTAPNQAFSWAFQQIPFQTYVAIPAHGGTNLLDKIAGQFPTLLTTNSAAPILGQAKRSPNDLEVVWVGLPVLVPFVRLVSEPGGQFLVSGVFPPPPSTNPAPTELFRQFQGRNNLVWYSWEITSERAAQWTKLGQLFSVIWPGLRFGTNSAGQKWLEEMCPHLGRQTAKGLQGDTITEMTVLSPKEVEIVRRSQVGFTGLELVALRYLLDRPDFPFFLLRQQPPGKAASP